MSDENELKGLGGWLILVGIGVLFSPVRLGVSFYNLYLPIFSEGTWEALTTPGYEGYSPYWAPFLIWEIAFNSLMLLASIALIFLFFFRHYFFPKFYIGILAASLIFIPIDAWIATLVQPGTTAFDAAVIKEFTRSVVVGYLDSVYVDV